MMAKTQEVKSEEPKAEETKVAAEGQKNPPVDVEPPNPPKTLAELMGDITTEVLTVLQDGDAGAKQATLQACLRRMRIWYDAQPVEGRKELARANRKMLEQFKLVAEQFYQEMSIISANDAL